MKDTAVPKALNKQEALNELEAIMDECNRIRHPFQNIYPMWRGRPLSMALKEIYNALNEGE